jgi:uncharacterized membrane protein YdjX (TVP38/TMEM64 family)
VREKEDGPLMLLRQSQGRTDVGCPANLIEPFFVRRRLQRANLLIDPGDFVFSIRSQRLKCGRGKKEEGTKCFRRQRSNYFHVLKTDWLYYGGYSRGLHLKNFQAHFNSLPAVSIQLTASDGVLSSHAIRRSRDHESPQCFNLAMNQRQFVGAALITAAVVLFFTIVLRVNFESIENYLAANRLLAPLLFSLLMIVGILIAPIPTSPLTLMSAKLFGLWGGLVLCLSSATIGALIAFFIGRKLGNRFLLRYPHYRRLQHLLPSDATAFTVFVLRLPPSPIFDAVSYLAGLTPMPVWQFAVATFLGMIPVTATLCFAGSLVPGVWLWPLLAALILFAVIQLWRRTSHPPEKQTRL